VSQDDADGFKIEITLRDTKWSDSRPVQANDIVFAWKRILEPEFKCEAASMLYDIKNAREVKMGDMSIDDFGVSAIETYVLEIEFEKKIDLDSFFRTVASPALVPLREDIVSENANWAKKASTMITNGPFDVKELTYGETMRLERSAYYYRNTEENDPLDKYVIPYRIITHYDIGTLADQLDALLCGELFYLGEIPLESREEYADYANATDISATHTYYFNLNNELLANADVRRALSMAIDRNEIVSIVTFAKAATGYIPYKVFDSKTGTSFREVGGDILSTTADVEGAKKLLADAGVKGGSFTLTVKDNEVDVAIAEYVADVWEDLGFDVTVDALGAKRSQNDEEIYVDQFQLAYDAGEFDVIAIDMNMLSTDAFSALSQFAVPFSGGGVDMYSETYDLYTHVTGYASEAYDAIIEQAFAEKDRAKRAAILHEAEQMLLDDMPVIPLVFLQDAYLVHDDISGMKNTYYGTRDFKDTKLKNYMDYKAATAQTEVVAED